MTGPYFFKRGHGLTVGEIATLIKAQPRTGIESGRRITGIARLDSASPDDLAFFDKGKYAGLLATCNAGACVTTERLAGRVPLHISVLCVHEPYRAFVEIARKLFPD